MSGSLDGSVFPVRRCLLGLIAASLVLPLFGVIAFGIFQSPRKSPRILASSPCGVAFHGPGVLTPSGAGSRATNPRAASWLNSNKGTECEIGLYLRPFRQCWQLGLVRTCPGAEAFAGVRDRSYLQPTQGSGDGGRYGFPRQAGAECRRQYGPLPRPQSTRWQGWQLARDRPGQGVFCHTQALRPHRAGDQ
jgi:hypothetical protein